MFVLPNFEFNPSGQKDFAPSYPNVWDAFSLALLLGMLVAIGHAYTGTSSNLYASRMDLSVSLLPVYAFYSVVRMFTALLFSLVVAIGVGTLAARSRLAEKIIVPVVDVLQSLPILGYLALAATLFVHQFPNRTLGFEAVAIFAIFTSQVWNMLLSVYQNIRMLPTSMQEVSAVMQLSRFQKFWRIDVPYATPDLILNTMISLSAGWFYVVESEAIPLGDEQGRYLLPGLGSYIWQAQADGNTHALFAACVTMFLVILAYDQLIFRPLSHAISAYKEEEAFGKRSWVVHVFMQTRWFLWLLRGVARVVQRVFLQLHRLSKPYNVQEARKAVVETYAPFWERGLLWGLAVAGVSVSIWYLSYLVDARTFLWVVFYGLCTTLRVFGMLLVATCVWLPVGVWIGFRPKIAHRVDPVVQFVAAFPPNLFYPLMMQLILYYQLDINIWCAPLMILGTQWYILVNVIAGVRSMPKNLWYVAKNLQMPRWAVWKHLIFPSVAPHLVSGALAAAGGAWNASIVAEVIAWNNHKLFAVGLGAFIAQHVGQVNMQIVGIAVMSAYVVLINRLFWYPLFRWVTKKYAK